MAAMLRQELRGAPAQVDLDGAGEATAAGLRSKTWIPAIAAALGAGLALGGAIGVQLISNQLRQELEAQRTVTPRAQQLASQGHVLQVVAWVGGGVAATGALSALIFQLLPGGAPAGPVAFAVPGGGVVGLQGVLP